MYELPRRESELVVEVEDGAVKLFLEPLSDAQYFQVNETSVVEGEGGEQRLVFRTSRLPGLFEDRLRRVEGVLVEGAAFDAKNPEHLARLPQQWKALANARLVRYAMGLTEADRGNSTRPGEGSPAEAVPAQS